MAAWIVEMDATAVDGAVEVSESIDFDSPTSISAWSVVNAFYQNADFDLNCGSVECSISGVTTQDASGARQDQNFGGSLGVAPLSGQGVFYGDNVVQIRFVLSLVAYADREVGARGIGVVLA